MTPRAPALSILLVLTACAPPLELDDDSAALEDTPISEQGGPQIFSELLDDGSVSTRVDASSEAAWIYLDLDTGKQLDVADAATDTAWDLGFQRFHVKMNSGVSGSGTLEGTFVAGADLVSIDAAPAGEYGVDLPDGPDEDEDPEYLFVDWYAYDVMTHVLTPEPGVYVVRDAETGAAYALEVVGYYDDAGSSGFVSFEWKPLE